MRAVPEWQSTDPAIRVITLAPEDGELWDSPNRAVAFAKMAVAAVTGTAPDFGDFAGGPRSG